MRNRKTSLYIAYGSNLNVRQMKTRCPEAEPFLRRKFALNDSQLVFRGYADVIYSPGHQAPAGLWRITKSDERALDLYEGVDSGLYSKEPVVLSDGSDALIYVMNDDGVAPPNRFYLDTIRVGYDNFKLDPAYLDEAVDRSWDGKEHSELTKMRYDNWRQDPQPARKLLAHLTQDVALRKIKRAHAKLKRKTA